MLEVKFEAEIVGMCSERKYPYGFEDKHYTSMEKDKVSTKKTARAVVERNFRSVESPTPTGDVTKGGETETRSKSNPWYRATRGPDGEIDRKLFDRMVQGKVRGLLKTMAPFCGNGITGGLSQNAVDALAVKIEVLDCEPLPEPCYQLHGLIGGQGAQPTYFEAFNVRIRGSVSAFESKNTDADVLKRMLTYADGQEIGAARIGTIHFTVK